jgi:hypothetical protein
MAKSAETPKRHWSLDMAIRAAGRITHFRSIGNRKKKQSKIFVSDTKIFVVEFENDEHVQTRELIREPHRSILGIEGEIERNLRQQGLL